MLTPTNRFVAGLCSFRILLPNWTFATYVNPRAGPKYELELFNVRKKIGSMDTLRRLRRRKRFQDGDLEKFVWLPWSVGTQLAAAALKSDWRHYEKGEWAAKYRVTFISEMIRLRTIRWWWPSHDLIDDVLHVLMLNENGLFCYTYTYPFFYTT